MNLPIVDPGLQISFYYRLQAIEDVLLHRALAAALDAVDLKEINAELNACVRDAPLKRVASFGLRGEVVFPVPCVLKENPYLLGYYRLLFGLSQKEFYSKGPFGRFKIMEERGTLSTRLSDDEIDRLCRSLVGTAEKLVSSLDQLSLDGIRDLQLLTLGPQFRGGENTRIGKSATIEVFNLIRDAVAGRIDEETRRTILSIRSGQGRAE